MSATCATCGQSGGARLRCSACQAREYCSAECQKADWSGHRPRCVPLPLEVPRRPYVLIIHLDNDASSSRCWCDHSSKQLHDALERDNYIFWARNATAARRGLAASPSGILVCDPAIFKRDNDLVLRDAVDYARTAGTLVFGSGFAGMTNSKQFEALGRTFEQDLGFTLTRGDYHRTEWHVRPALARTLEKPSRKLPQKCSLKCQCLGGIPDQYRLYASQPGAVSQSLVPFMVREVADTQTPLVWAPFGAGHFGYSGDVNGEDASTMAVFLMLSGSERRDV